MRIFRTFYSRPHQSCRIQIGRKLLRAGHFGIGIKPRCNPADFLHPGGNDRPTCRFVVQHTRQMRQKFSTSSSRRPA